MKIKIDFENKEIGANVIAYIKNFIDENKLEALLEITNFKPRIIHNAEDAELIKVFQEIKKTVFALLERPTDKNNFNC
jgi:arsenate reductase-like glutaredoxin family protein